MAEGHATLSLDAVRRLTQRIVPAVPDDEGAELLESGIIDSFSLVEIVAALEEALGQEFGPDEMRAENFRNLGTIWTLVQSMQRR